MAVLLSFILNPSGFEEPEQLTLIHYICTYDKHNYFSFYLTLHTLTMLAYGTNTEQHVTSVIMNKKKKDKIGILMKIPLFSR